MPRIETQNEVKIGSEKKRKINDVDDETNKGIDTHVVDKSLLGENGDSQVGASDRPRLLKEKKRLAQSKYYQKNRDRILEKNRVYKEKKRMERKSLKASTNEKNNIIIRVDSATDTQPPDTE